MKCGLDNQALESIKSHHFVLVLPMGADPPLSTLSPATAPSHMACIADKSTHSQFSKLAVFSSLLVILPKTLSPSSRLVTYSHVPSLQTVRTREIYIVKPCRLQGKIPSCRNRPTRAFSKLQSVSKSTWAMCNVSKGPLRWSWRKGTLSTVRRKIGLKEED